MQLSDSISNCLSFEVDSKMHANRKLIGLVAAAIPLLAVPTAANASDSQVWLGGSVTVKLSSKWAVTQDATARFSDDRHGLYEIEMNSLLGYQLNKTVSVWLGYDHVPQYSSGNFTLMEHRLPQIITFTNFASIGRGKMTGRVRFEERWRDGRLGTGWRVRPYLRYSVPFSKATKVALTLSAEPWIDFNKTSFQTTGGLDRMRSLVAVTAPVGGHFSADIGYMNQHFFVPNGADRSDNIAYFSLGLKL
jgi:hypothetical protein